MFEGAPMRFSSDDDAGASPREIRAGERRYGLDQSRIVFIELDEMVADIGIVALHACPITFRCAPALARPHSSTTNVPSKSQCRNKQRNTCVCKNYNFGPRRTLQCPFPFTRLVTPHGRPTNS